MNLPSVNIPKIVELDADKPVWERCFMVAPLVLVGTRDDDGSLDLAPKHMAFPMGWDNYFGFVCSPRHRTCSNIARSNEFTVSYPKPSQVLYASLAASPRYVDGPKPVLGSFEGIRIGPVPESAVEARSDPQRIQYIQHGDAVHDSIHE